MVPPPLQIQPKCDKLPINLEVFYALLTLNKSKYLFIIITNIHGECFGTFLIFLKGYMFRMF
jgi:hypothetical protein